MEQSSHIYSHISIFECSKIEVFLTQGMSISNIARILNRPKSPISCEIKHGRYNESYTAPIAQACADQVKLHPRKLQKAQNQNLMPKMEIS